MMSKKLLTIPMILSSMLIFSGCFMQPKTVVEERWNFIDATNQPALRVGKPIRGTVFDLLLRRDVKVELLQKTESGEWVSIGKGTIPPGAYIRGQAPKVDLEK